MKKKLNQKKSKKLRYFLYTIFVLIFLCVAAVLFWDKLPYQSAAKRQIVDLLEDLGLTVNSLEIESVGRKSTVITNIDLGDNKHLLLNKLRADYDLQQLISNQMIKNVEIEGLQLQLYKQNGDFLLGGLEPLLSSDTKSSGKIDFDALIANSPDSLVLKDAQLNSEMASFPFDLSFSKAGTPEINMSSKQLDLVMDKNSVSAKDIKITAKYDAETKKINGKLTAKKIQIAAEELDIPELALNVDFSLSAKELNADIKLHSKDKKWKLLAKLEMPVENPSGAIAQIDEIKFPYAGGEISAKLDRLNINMSKVISAKVQLMNVDLNDLMQKISDGKVSGSGSISGSMPVKYYPDGRIEFGSGGLKNNDSGVISVAPELLAGDNTQMEIARTALENFNYTILKIGVSSSKDGKLIINLNMYGNNPDAFLGREIRLNVNLSGDVLPLIQQSILPINDIKQLLKEAE